MNGRRVRHVRAASAMAAILHMHRVFHIRAQGYSWGIKGELLQLRRGPTVYQGKHSLHHPGFAMLT